MKHFSLKGSLAGAVLILAVLCSAGCGCDVSWKQANQGPGAKPDDGGDVLIIGGTVTGPSGGGEASWTIPTSLTQINRLSLIICMNGDRHWGKGIHSNIPNGSVEIFVNDTLVHTITSTVKGEYGDYWPSNSPAGSKFYDTGQVDVSAMNIKGPSLVLKIKASPGTVLDVNGLKLSATS
jgi:hypothetical protein